MVRMEDAFAIVLFVVVGIAAVAAIWALVTSRSSYDQIDYILNSHPVDCMFNYLRPIRFYYYIRTRI